MEKNRVIQDLEARFRQRLENYSKAIRVQFPGIEVQVWSWGATDWHNIGIDCSIADIPLDRPNNVALFIEVTHLASERKFLDASVHWGNPSGSVEIDLFGEGNAPYTEANIAIIEGRLDDLAAALCFALRRGRPVERPEA